MERYEEKRRAVARVRSGFLLHQTVGGSHGSVMDRPWDNGEVMQISVMTMWRNPLGAQWQVGDGAGLENLCMTFMWKSPVL